MNKKMIWIAAAAVLAVVLALVLFRPGQEDYPQVEEPDASSSQTVENRPADQSGQSGGEETQEPAPQPDAQPDARPTPEPKPVTPSAPQQEFLNFPCTVPGTDLVVESVRSYDGLYLEDGSDAEIKGVASIILKNTGKDYVDLATVILTGTEASYEFVAVSLEPGASMVVQEAHKAPAVSQSYTSAAADVALTGAFELSETALKLEDTADGRIQVTNISGRDIPCVRLFYKFYMTPENVYVGGITYTVKLVDLKAGASVQVAPSHYVAGNSRIVMAKLYDTAED